MMEYLFDARLIFRNLHMFGSVYSISESAYNLVQFGAVASASVDTNYLGILLHTARFSVQTQTLCRFFIDPPRFYNGGVRVRNFAEHLVWVNY
jgi:hypothetical protein